MPSVTFEPVRPQARMNFQVDGTAPPEVLAVGADGIAWDIRPEEMVRLSSGGKLKDIGGSVYLRVGDATPDGKETIRSGVRWGGLYYREAKYEFGERYTVDLHVSRRIFDRVLRLVEMGRPPCIDLELGDEDKLTLEGADAKTGIKYGYDPEGRDLDWDNKAHPTLEIVWCKFVGQLGTRVPEDAECEADDHKPNVTQWMPPIKRDVAEVRDRIVAVQVAIQKFAGHALFVGWVIAILLAVLIFR